MIGECLLGKKTIYPKEYNPKLLYPIARKLQRDTIVGANKFNSNGSIEPSGNINLNLGVDIWHGYEFSWLDASNDNLPVDRIIKIYIPSSSKNLIESKSFKLYLYSFANSSFASEQEVITRLQIDIGNAIQADTGNAIQADTNSADILKQTDITSTDVRKQAASVIVKLLPIKNNIKLKNGFDGILLDNLDITCNRYMVTPEYLQVNTHINKNSPIVTEQLYSNLLKSNCLITSKPDWGSIYIKYTGRQISHEGLLKYIISFRNHDEFHEHCVERIFSDLMIYCQPSYLLVKACYTRRGGLDINPIRATIIDDSEFDCERLFRH